MADVKKISIIGSGKIGQSWAILFASSGYKISLHDVSEERIELAIDGIRSTLQLLESENLLRGSLSKEQHLALISGTASLEECIKDAYYIQECVNENLELKLKVLGAVDAIVGPDTVVATSTSTIPGSQLSKDLKCRERFLVSHPVNPPILCPLVELVPAPWTQAEAVERAEKIMKESGQEPVRLRKEVVGFAVNRLQYALLAECWRLVCDDVMSWEDVDKVVSQGLGMRWAFFGPMEVAALNGEGAVVHNETYGRGFANVCNDFGPPPNILSPEIQKISKEEIDSKSSPEKLKQRREYRDKALVGLVKLKRQLEKQNE